MCTLTYLPLHNGYTLFHTRDEVPERNSPKFPIVEEYNGTKLYRPLDSRSKGSWIVTSSEGITGCILNGAFKRHERKPPYRHSRGKILLDIMESDDKLSFLEAEDYHNIEPFTLVLFMPEKIIELRWDEQKKHLKAINNTKPQIWSSATLYPEQKANERAGWFEEWLSQKGANSSTLEDFHHRGGVGDPEYDIVMKRDGGPCSVSITSLVKTGEVGQFCFEDLIRKDKKCTTIHYGKKTK